MQSKVFLNFLLFFIFVFSLKAKTLVDDKSSVPHRGVYELSINFSEKIENPYTIDLKIKFKRPNGTNVEVDAFFDGGNTFKARAYADQLGKWHWTSSSSIKSLDKKSNFFIVRESKLKGKLRVSKKDPHQFAYDNGDWFLHIGDTGYRYVNKNEPNWKVYLDQAVQMGATKIRTWFNSSRSGVQGLWKRNDRNKFDLEYWQEIDKRLSYALNKYPHIIFQLIPFGEDSRELIKYYNNDLTSKRMAKYAQARFSAFSNIYWCISNDRYIEKGSKQSKILKRSIDIIATDMHNREPWGTLITNHQGRLEGYSYTKAKWSDIVTLETFDEVNGKIIQKYLKEVNTPIVLDEDRYETYSPPENKRYFFRRLMWASLFSGGSATYGGLKSWEAYDGDMIKGINAYFDACKDGRLEKGAHDFRRIHEFFEYFDIELIGMKTAYKDDTIFINGKKDVIIIKNEEIILAYFSNPNTEKVRIAKESTSSTKVLLNLPKKDWTVQWFNPKEGGENSILKENTLGGVEEFETPKGGDWILVLKSYDKNK